MDTTEGNIATSKTNSCDHFTWFQFLGHFVGGFLPIAIFLICEHMGIQRTLPPKYLGVFCCLGYSAGCLAPTASFLHAYYGPLRRRVQIFFAFQAVYSFLLVHLLVLYTGGPESSVFALSYLYLLTVIGFTFGPDIKLYGAAGVVFISYLTALYWPTQQVEFLNQLFSKLSRDATAGEFIPQPGKFIYIIIFMLQLIVSMFTAGKCLASSADAGKA